MTISRRRAGQAEAGSAQAEPAIPCGYHGNDALNGAGLWCQSPPPFPSPNKGLSGMSNDYSRDQILDAVRNNIVTFTDLIADMQDSVDDRRLHMFIERLLANIYVRHLEGGTISRSQACRMIPADHIDTCKKYVSEAERLGFVRFEKDPSDGRRMNVVPTEGLIAYVDDRARASLNAAAMILQGKPVAAREPAFA